MRSIYLNEGLPWYSDEVDVANLKDRTINDYLSMTPQDIKRELEKSVVSQSEACKQVSLMMYQHLRGHRSVNLVAGPTGSGKSFITETLKDIFPDIVYIRDVSGVSMEGWTGNKKLCNLFQGVQPKEGTHVIHPFMVFDECDKLFAPKISSSGEHVNENIQAEFLTAIQGTDVSLKGSSETVDTRPMSFLFAGAFEKRAKAIAEKETGCTIGFGATQKKVQSYSRDLTMEDVHEAGCIHEMCGRIQKIICLNKIGEDEYISILRNEGAGPIYELENEFDIKLILSDSKKEEIATNAVNSGLGIRSIKNQIRTYIDEAIWDDCNARKIEIA